MARPDRHEAVVRVGNKIAGERVPVILFVDDDPDIRELVELGLEDDPGLTLIACADPPAAQHAYARNAPDLIVLDVNLAGASGVDLMALLDAIRSPLPPVVFLTADTQAKEIERLMDVGARDVITKPFDALGLAARLRGYL